MHVQIQSVRRQRFAHADILSQLGETLCIDLPSRKDALEARPECAGAAAPRRPACDEEEPERWDGLE